MTHSLPPANIIMGTSFEFYIALFFFCIVVVPLEALIFKKLEKINFTQILLLISLANLTSWFIGFIFSFFILDPLPLFSYSYFDGRKWVVALFSTFISAFILSWLIEYLFIKLFNKRFSFSHLFKTTGYANMSSYLLIYIICFSLIIIQGLFF